tara:strand:+ start:21409 stop:22383 length:975 start_codon:yes stop_codon:yes gene_type:complete
MDWVRRPSFTLFELNEREYSWRGLFLLAYVYLGSLLFAAVVAPWVYFMVQSWAQAYPNELNTYLSGKAFDDYFDRLRYVPILLGLPWILRVCRLWSLQALVVDVDEDAFARFIKMFMGGLLLVGGIALVQIKLLPVAIKADVSLLKIVSFSLVGALLVALIEEIVFRGLIVRLFYTALNPFPAVVWSALFFAYVHFKMPSAVWHSTDKIVTWKSGFFVGFWTLIGITQDFQWLAFTNLFLLGCLLAFLFLRTRSLLPCIGFHAGIVWVMLVYKKLFFVPESFLWGGSKLIDGLLTLGLLLLLNLYLVCRSRYHVPRSSSPRKIV